MLILTRRVGESIMIGNNVEVKVTRIRGGFVVLGIEAPTHIKVLRDELVEHYQEPLEEKRLQPEENDSLKKQLEAVRKENDEWRGKVKRLNQIIADDSEQLEAVRDCYVVGNATQTHINMFKLLGEGDEQRTDS